MCLIYCTFKAALHWAEHVIYTNLLSRLSFDQEVSVLYFIFKKKEKCKPHIYDHTENGLSLQLCWETEILMKFTWYNFNPHVFPRQYTFGKVARLRCADDTPLFIHKFYLFMQIQMWWIGIFEKVWHFASNKMADCGTSPNFNALHFSALKPRLI